MGKDHANAFATLERVGSQYDPECVICHVIGMDYDSGFITEEKTPLMKDVVKTATDLVRLITCIRTSQKPLLPSLIRYVSNVIPLNTAGITREMKRKNCKKSNIGWNQMSPLVSNIKSIRENLTRFMHF